MRHDDLVPEGPFGEYTGYMGAETNSYRVDLTCVTHRNNPIYQAFLSQMPPSESSCIRQVGREAALLHHLTSSLGLPVTGVHVPESGAAGAFVIIAMRNARSGQVRQAVLGSLAHDPSMGKFTIVVDDDIDIRDTGDGELGALVSGAACARRLGDLGSAGGAARSVAGAGSCAAARCATETIEQACNRRHQEA